MITINKIVGILGGMGPEATVDIFDKIVKLTPAKNDQEHLKILTFCNPQIPDRTEAIVNGGQTPLPALIETAKVLEKAGADFLVIPCNTAHYYFDELQEKIEIPIINMIEETAKTIYEKIPNIKQVGLMSTTGTIESKIYNKNLSKYNIEVLIPSKNEIEQIMNIIYAIKADKCSKELENELLSIANQLIDRGAEAVILGCTELPLLFNRNKFQFPLFIPQDILAQKAVQKSRNEYPEI